MDRIKIAGRRSDGLFHFDRRGFKYEVHRLKSGWAKSK